MKTMKNVLMILLGAALVLSLAGVGAVAAASDPITITKEAITQETIDRSGYLTVFYTIGESFSVTIPTEVTPSNTDEPTPTTFSVDSATLGTNSKFVVNITSDNDWRMMINENDNDNVIPYTMSYKVGSDNPVPVDESLDEVNIYETTKSVLVTSPYSISLLFKMDAPDNLPTMAGKYTDTLTFIITHTPTTAE